MSRHAPTVQRPRLSHAATIRDVALHAGVSIATASRVFTKPEVVRDALRERVLDSVRTLMYRPSQAARTLRAGTSKTVGVIIPDLQNPFFTAVVRGVDREMKEAGYSLLLGNSDEDPAREDELLTTLSAENVAGIVIVPIDARKSTYQDLLEPHRPIVATDRLPASLQADCVTVDNAAGARLAIEHLLGLGHRRIALLNGPSKHSTAVERERGYLAALRAADVRPQPELIYRGDFSDAAGYLGMRELMRPRPSAVFVANNLMTLGALRALHEMRVRIPGDLALVSFDDMPWAASLNPPLTAVAQPDLEIGRSAAELLLARIADPDRPVRHLVLDSTLIVRASCGAPASARVQPRDPHPRDTAEPAALTVKTGRTRRS
jgi:LacI family transcriptional regulator